MGPLAARPPRTAVSASRSVAGVVFVNDRALPADGGDQSRGWAVRRYRAEVIGDEAAGDGCELDAERERSACTLGDGRFEVKRLVDGYGDEGGKEGLQDGPQLGDSGRVGRSTPAGPRPSHENCQAASRVSAVTFGPSRVRGLGFMVSSEGRQTEEVWDERATGW